MYPYKSLSTLLAFQIPPPGLRDGCLRMVCAGRLYGFIRRICPVTSLYLYSSLSVSVRLQAGSCTDADL